jgi:hypothetical protein
MGKQVYYKKIEEQKEKCGYCRNLEAELNKVNQNIQKFIDGNFTILLRDQNINEYISNKLLQKHSLEYDVSQCKFPYCGKCRNREGD